ncbi:MAG TPA: hypothetical protein PKE63_14640, partial [Lacibacter sp.]|nr:hypothetical protein [Lacibacter sp.]
MRKLLLSALSLVLAGMSGTAQTNFEGFESASFATVAAGGFGFTVTGSGGTAGRITGNTTAASRPSNVPFAASGTAAFRVTNTVRTLTSGDISTIGSSFVALRLRVKAVSIGSDNDGPDNGDFIRVRISPNGGTTWYTRLFIRGSASGSDNWWPYSSSVIANATYATNNTATTVNGNASNNTGPSTAIIRGLPITSNLRIEIQMDVNTSDEAWVIDDVELIRSTLGPLPVNFANVSAKALASNVEVKWSNLTESDISHYNVERSSDGQNFKVIGTIQP